MSENSATTEAPAGGDSVADVQTTTYSDDDQIVEALMQEHLASNGEAKAETPSDTTDETEVEESKESETKVKAKESKAAYTGPAYKTGEEAVTSILEAFESGDPEKMAKATGKPKNFFVVSDAKWADFRKKENNVRTREKELTVKEGKFKVGQEAANREFGTAIRASLAYQEGDLESFVTLVEELTKESYDEAQRKVIKGEIALPDNVKAERKKLREAEKKIAELEAAQKPKEKSQQDLYNEYVVRVEAELAGHKVAKVKGFGREVLEKVKASYSDADGTFTLSVKEAADQLLEERAAEAEALGLRTPAATTAPRKAPKAQTPPPRARAADARVETQTVDEDDDDAIIADLQRQYKRENR